MIYHKQLNFKVALIGTLPPPIGGVSIHVSRLLNSLLKIDSGISFIDYKRREKSEIFTSMYRSKIVHIHINNSIFILLFTLFSKMLFKRVIITYHGNLGQFNTVRNFMDMISIIFSDVPILLNKHSFNKAFQLNNNARLLSAYIKPLKCVELPNHITDKIDKIVKKHSFIYSTNAFRYVLDNNGEEIYSISLLISLFQKLPQHALLVSDPSGTYKEYFYSNNINIPDNVYLIAEEHDFIKILERSDIFLRITTTDGDSISVHEALNLNKTVIATNCVERPSQAIIVPRDYNTIFKLLKVIKPQQLIKEKYPETVEEILQIYYDLL